MRLHLVTLLLEDGRAAALDHCQAVLGKDPSDADAVELAGRARKALGAVGETAAVELSPRPDRSAEPVGAGEPGAVSARDLYEIFRPLVTLDDVAGMTDVKER
ncbi:MAG: hypothetical protein ACRDHK_13225, partial [Actinomycetota bacterium]